MSTNKLDTLRYLTLLWVADQLAARERELVATASSLSAQLSEARTENRRLRVMLQSSLRALAPARLGGQ
jgi:hypothetical protein